MDGLSIAASIIAVLQFTSQVITYLNDVKDAPKECRKCMVEVSNSNTLLLNLNLRLCESSSQKPWYIEVQALAVKDGPLDQYKLALEHLLAKVEPTSKMRKLASVLTWNFIKEEVASILARMERLKILVNIALEMDHFKLSLTINEDTSFVRDTIPILQTNVVTIRGAQSLQLDAQKLQQHHTMMQWLSPADFPAQQHDIISRRQEGTGQWLLNSLVFKRWLQEADRIYFVLTNVGLAYLFCHYKSQIDQSLFVLLNALLKQLVQNRPDIAAPVTRLYDHHSKRNSRPSPDDMFEALLTICSTYTQVYVVVDALDECADQDGSRSRLVEKLRELQARANVRLLFTSRFIPEITEKFQLDPMLEVQASEEDVKRFVAGQIPRLPSCIRRDDELTSVVQSKIVEAVGGMFLLARLHVDSLLDKRTKQKVLSTLEKLLKGSAALDEAYSDAIERIDGQLTEDRLLAKRTISWISYAQRPLTIQELRHALAINLGDRALNTDNLHDVEDVVSVCAGLVTIDKESNVVRLVHDTTQDYFKRICLEWNPNAQKEIALTCLTYLAFEKFQCGYCRSDEDFEERIRKSVLLKYAAQYWAEHVLPIEEMVSKLALTFLQDEALVSSSTQVISVGDYMYEKYSQGFPQSTTGLHLSARFGLGYLSRMLLTIDCKETSICADSKDSYGWTPLSWAARNGHEAVVKLLVETGKADVDLKDDYGQTPLSWAARNGHEALVKLLIETGKADVDSKDGYGQTPLSWAARNGHEAVVKLLVETGKVDVDLKDGDSGRTPLSWAARNGHEVVVKLLVETGKVDVDSKDSYSWKPLSWAAENGHEAVVKLLQIGTR